MRSASRVVRPVPPGVPAVRRPFGRRPRNPEVDSKMARSGPTLRRSRLSGRCASPPCRGPARPGAPRDRDRRGVRNPLDRGHDVGGPDGRGVGVRAGIPRSHADRTALRPGQSTPSHRRVRLVSDRGGRPSTHSDRNPVPGSARDGSLASGRRDFGRGPSSFSTGRADRIRDPSPEGFPRRSTDGAHRVGVSGDPAARLVRVHGDAAEDRGGPVTAILPSSPPPATSRPVLLTSLTSAALLDGRGDLTLPQETRGTIVDWGGVYGQLVRLTGPWTIDLTLPSGTVDLPSVCVAAGPIPGGWQTRHRIEGLEVVQDVVAIPRPAGVGRRIRLISSEAHSVRVRLTSRFAPYLLPVLVEGIRPVTFRVTPSPNGVLVRQEGFALRALARGADGTVSVDGTPLTDREYRGPVRTILFDHLLDVPPNGQAEVRWEIRGGIGRDLEAAERVVGEECVPLDLAGAAFASSEAEWLRHTPELEFPDAPELALAYRSARSALRTLYSAPGDGPVGLVAGYPWYSAIWCRDLAVMLPALLWLGDSEWVERSLTSVFRYQCHRTLPILGGEPGELPMQVAPGPIFLYGTSDSTLRFPEVVEQYPPARRRQGFTGRMGGRPAPDRGVGPGAGRSGHRIVPPRGGGRGDRRGHGVPRARPLRDRLSRYDHLGFGRPMGSRDRRAGPVVVHALRYRATPVPRGGPCAGRSVPEGSRDPRDGLADPVCPTGRRLPLRHRASGGSGRPGPPERPSRRQRGVAGRADRDPDGPLGGGFRPYHSLGGPDPSPRPTRVTTPKPTTGARSGPSPQLGRPMPPSPSATAISA